MSTKIMAVVFDEDTVLAIAVVSSQAGDPPRLVPMLDRTRERPELVA